MNIQKLFLLLGSNMGDRANYLKKTLLELEKTLGNSVLQSSLYETAAWGNTEQPGFLNQVLMFEVHTGIDAKALLDKLLAIEKQLGRVRHQHWGQRTIDIDMLFLGDQIIEIAGLTVPHPRLHLRKFTLVPLNEIAPRFVHPKIKKTVNELLTVCSDDLDVQKWVKP